MRFFSSIFPPSAILKFCTNDFGGNLTTVVVDTGKFTNSMNFTGGQFFPRLRLIEVKPTVNLPPLSTMPVINLLLVSMATDYLDLKLRATYR